MATQRKGKKVKRVRRKRRIFVFLIELIALFAILGVIVVFKNMDKIADFNFDEDKIETNNVTSEVMLEGYQTIALFGLDSRDAESLGSGNNSDTMIIASINNDTKEVKLVSLYRDTYLRIEEGDYGKANSAYCLGGPEQAISMLNTNLDLNIEDYLTVNMLAVANVIDELGGIDIEITDAELVHMNNYIIETSKITGIETDPVANSGQVHLNGVQATAYSRIRYTAGDDYKRTERQRLVISKIIEEAKKSDLITLTNVVNAVFPEIQTSLSKTEIIEFISVAFDYSLGDTTGFPFEKQGTDVNGSDAITAVDLEENVVALHEFLYGEDTTYTPSSELQDISDYIKDVTGVYGEESESIDAQDALDDFTEDFDTGE